MLEGKALHFDPDIVDAFVEIQDEFRAIAARYADSNDDIEKKKEFFTTAIAGPVEIQ
jgi:putative two-component system response regulator